MNNQKGGVISKLIAIPAALALMAGFFFLGYNVGKHKGSSGKADAALSKLPDIISQNLPKQEDLTFYKTLTDKDSKTVSIELKPKSMDEEQKTERKDSLRDKGGDVPEIRNKPDKKAEIRQAAPQIKQVAQKPGQNSAKREQAQASRNNKLRYTIQVSAHTEKGMAEEDVKSMKKRGYAAFIVTTEIPEKGTWHRVRLGSFSNKASAEKLAKELRSKEGLSPFVTIE